MEPPAPEAGDSRSRAWVSLGVTWAAFPEDIRADVGLLGALTFQRGPHHVSLRGMGFTEIVSSADNVVELAALYGRTRSGSWAHAAAAVGLAAVVVGRGSPGSARTVLGLPLMAEASAHAGVVGLGIQVHANLNREASFAGVGLFLQLGWMPP